MTHVFQQYVCVCGLCLHLHCFLTYLFSLILFPFTLFILYPLWKEEGICKWLDKHMNMILSCLARSFKSSQRETHQILRIPISLQNLLLGIHILRQSILHQIKGVSNSTLAECCTQMSGYDVYIAPTLPHLPPFLFLHLMRNLYLNRTLSTMAAGKCWCSVRVAH